MDNLTNPLLVQGLWGTDTDNWLGFNLAFIEKQEEISRMEWYHKAKCDWIFTSKILNIASNKLIAWIFTFKGQAWGRKFSNCYYHHVTSPKN